MALVSSGKSALMLAVSFWSRVRSRFTKTRLRYLLLVGASAFIAYFLAAQVVVHRAGADHTVSLDDAQLAPVVVVPGARVYQDGQPSQFLRQRLDAAAALHASGTVDHILVSGDNRKSRYNEPEAMREYLLADISAQDITLDFAGFDTWDTCIRAAEQFGVTEAIVVTQERFAHRTAALCNRAGIDATVVSLPTPVQAQRPRIQSTVRERLANVKAWRDMVTRPEPHHGGEFVGLVGSE